MIRIDKIQTGLSGEVGFRNSDLTGLDIVSSENQATNSGLYFQDGSELVTIKNIKDCQPNPDITTDNFNAYLARLRKAVVLDVCNKVLKDQSDFVSTLNLFPFEKSFEHTLDHKGRFVGFEIEPYANGNKICSIPWVEISFDEIVTFNLYLYNSNLPKSPIQTKSVTTVAGESTIVALDWVIGDDTTYKGGNFYLGYFDNDLGSAKAYKKDHNISILSVRTPYYEVNPISLGHSGTTIDITDEVYEAETFGLNIGMNVFSDYTELILRNKSMFWNAIQLQMHEKVLMMIKFNTRLNSTEKLLYDKVRDDLNLELYGNKEMAISGVQDKLNKSIEAIRKALFYVPKISRGTLG